jgi:hypothetical protein
VADNPTESKKSGNIQNPTIVLIKMPTIFQFPFKKKIPLYIFIFIFFNGIFFFFFFLGGKGGFDENLHTSRSSVHICGICSCKKWKIK